VIYCFNKGLALKPITKDETGRKSAGGVELKQKKLGGNGMISRCENCKLRKYADKNPDSLIARFWRWHTRWCPGWKAYQKKLSR
jgi:hypothetical protein